MPRKIFVLFIWLLIICPVVCGAEKEIESAVEPAHRHSWWTLRHEAVLERVKQGNVDLLFIGDSITHSWEGNGKEVWAKYYSGRKALNLGFSGDRTQHVLWRLDNGEVEGISPKVAVIMIGTNNSNKDEYTAEEIAAGIIAICQKLQAKLPKTKILLLGIFPRGTEPSAQREKNARASELASEIADGKKICYLDIGRNFLEADGSISPDIMYDYLHLTPKGYQIWAESMEAKLVELLGEKK